jgi:hypothetical protein
VTGAGRSVTFSLWLIELGVRGNNDQDSQGLAEVRS